MEENNLTITEQEQTIDLEDVEVVLPFALNRHTRRKFNKLKIEYRLVENRVQTLNSNKSEFQEFKKDLALTHGSTTGKLKKKHLNRELIKTGKRSKK